MIPYIYIYIYILHFFHELLLVIHHTSSVGSPHLVLISLLLVMLSPSYALLCRHDIGIFVSSPSILAACLPLGLPVLGKCLFQRILLRMDGIDQLTQAVLARHQRAHWVVGLLLAAAGTRLLGVPQCLVVAVLLVHVECGSDARRRRGGARATKKLATLLGRQVQIVGNGVEGRRVVAGWVALLLPVVDVGVSRGRGCAVGAAVLVHGSHAR